MLALLTPGRLAEYRKALVQLAHLAAQAVAYGMLTGSTLHYVQVALAVLGALGVFIVPNAPAPDVAIAPVDQPAVYTEADALAHATVSPASAAAVTQPVAVAPVPSVDDTIGA